MGIPDPTEEIKAIRHQLGAAFDFDLERIVIDIQTREAESGRTFVTLPPRTLPVPNDTPPEPTSLISSSRQSTSPGE
jgi:hypothetical protein